ncbi:hypothetical protein V470_10820 [Streptococcus sp. VT 162]|nr:hypothetical protein V470_10820 [Streptococcus sp. VT 162]
MLPSSKVGSTVSCENIVVEIGDVLFGKLRPYLRKFWRATFPSTASSEFLVFQSSELDMNFLYYAIQSDSFIEEVTLGLLQEPFKGIEILSALFDAFLHRCFDTSLNSGEPVLEYIS